MTDFDLTIPIDDRHSDAALHEAFLNDDAIRLTVGGVTVARGLITDYAPDYARLDVLLTEDVGVWVASPADEQAGPATDDDGA